MKSARAAFSCAPVGGASALAAFAGPTEISSAVAAAKRPRILVCMPDARRMTLTRKASRRGPTPPYPLRRIMSSRVVSVSREPRQPTARASEPPRASERSEGAQARRPARPEDAEQRGHELLARGRVRSARLQARQIQPPEPPAAGRSRATEARHQVAEALLDARRRRDARRDLGAAHALGAREARSERTGIDAQAGEAREPGNARNARRSRV